MIKQNIINYFKHFPEAVLANIINNFPSKSLKIIGITGTDGKTTTVNMVYHILKYSGLRAGMVSTVCAKFDDKVVDTGLHVTSPDPWFLQNLLKKMVKKGIKYVILETTSQGLDQFRFWGINFDAGILTNITRDHLDYHWSMENYLNTKLILLKRSKSVILNKDDNSFADIINKHALDPRKVFTYGINTDCDFKAENINNTEKGVHFILRTEEKKYSVDLPLIGNHNIYNCLASLLASVKLGVDLKIALEGLKSFPGVEGRLEEIPNDLGYKIYIDFAHTPNGLKNVLEALSERKKNRLIAVFGSAGKRDKSKRPIMGKIAAEIADIIILTQDDNRDESVEEISRQIALGCEEGGKKEININESLNSKGYALIGDRKQAIYTALAILAKKNDTVVFCGKGHEKSLAVGDKEYPWSDQQEVIDVLSKIKEKK